MATKSEGKPEQASKGSSRPEAADGGPSGAAAASRSLSDQLQQARCEYWQAVQRSWVQAAHDVNKANAEFVATQQRIALDTELQNAAAQRSWFRTMQDARLSQATNAGEQIRSGYQGYQQAINAMMQSGRDQWAECRQSYQDALAAVQETYGAATREALNAYLAQVKGAWNAADIAAADTAMLASLAEASSHALNAASALRWSEWNLF